jgi:Dual-action HEIGH metallo-peptidase
MVGTEVGRAQLRCPACYSDQIPFSGHGAAPDGSGRRVITVKVDTATWGSPLPPNIAQGTQKAADLWNAKATCYYFQVVTTGTPDYVVTAATSPIGGCADDILSSYPREIQLLNTLQATFYTSDRIGTLISHELGHGIGLDNADNGCPNGASVMEGYYGTGCQGITKGPTSADVAKANQNCSDSQRSFCERKQPVFGVGLPLTSSCPWITTACPYIGPQYAADGPYDVCKYAAGCPYSYDSFMSATGCCYRPQSPIIVDLGRSGFHLTDVSDGVYFDFPGAGVPTRVSWLAPGGGNAWLALDRNNNGKIDSGAELFGNYTPQPASTDPNGFHALAVFDDQSNGGNGDGVIDERDSVFSRLRLWTDDNHNGVSEPDELHSLQEFGVLGIDLKYRGSKWEDAYGNTFRYKGRVLRDRAWDDRSIYDVFLLTNE